jgi:hypothetical protein
LALARRYTGRSTDQQQPPPDPNRRVRTRRAPAERRSASEDANFSAELFVLFGLPALVLVLSYAFNDPGALLISLPLLMLIPGIRDVLLALVTDGIRAARNGWRFVSLDSQDLSDSEYERPQPAQQRAEWREAQAQRRAQAWLRAQEEQQPPPPPPPQPVWQAQQQPEWSRRVRPPPPPPEYELRPGEYSVLPPSSTAAASPRSPFADGWPEDGSFCDLPHSPFAPDWQVHQQQQQAYAHQPYAQQQPHPQQQGAWASPSTFGGAGAWQGEMPAAAAERVAASRRRRAARSGGSRSAAAPAAVAGSREAQRAAAASPGRSQQAGRLVRPASKGRVGVDMGRERDTTPLLLRPIFALIPFLRYWGGFL